MLHICIKYLKLECILTPKMRLGPLYTFMSRTDFCGVFIMTLCPTKHSHRITSSLYLLFFFFWVVHYRTALQVQRTCLHREAIIPSHSINIYINHFLSSTFLQHIFFTHLKIFYLVFPISLRLKYSSWDFFW